MKSKDLLKKISAELKKDVKYIKLLKYNYFVNVIKYFCINVFVYFLLVLINNYFNFIGEYFIVYFSICSVFLFLFLLYFRYFEYRFIYELSFKNKCISLIEFYEFILRKRSE